MNALKRKNPLTESFMVQLDVDLESLGLRHPKYKSIFAYSEDNLGLSSANSKQIGDPPRGGFPRRWANECNYLRILEDAPATADPDSPADVATRSGESQQSPDSALKTTFSGDTRSWVPLEQQTLAPEQEVQRTMQGLVLGQIITSTYKPGELSGSYVNSESSNGPDAGLSPDAGNSSSNRPTPNSSTSSDTHPSLQQRRTPSSHTSFETSPSIPNQTRLPDSRGLSNFFGTQADYSNLSSTGLTPDNTFTMPETPGRDFPVPSGWEMSQQPTGLTPVGEGVFRHLMGLGGVDPMDLGWEGGS